MENNKKAELLLIANEKGGTGKTATCLILANCLTAMGYKVLVVDTDPSGNLSLASLPNVPDKVIYDVFRGKCKIFDAIQHTDIADILPTVKDVEQSPTIGEDGTFALPESKSLNGIIKDLESTKNGELSLCLLLRHTGLRQKYDFILMDSAPSDSLLIVNAIVAADSILVPCEPNANTINGLMMFHNSIQRAMVHRQKAQETFRKLEPDYPLVLNHDGILLSRYTNDWHERRQYTATILGFAKDSEIYAYNTRIRRSAPIETSMNNCRPILDYMNIGTGATDALNFTLEFLQKRGLEPRNEIPGVVKNEYGSFTYLPNGEKYFELTITGDTATAELKSFRADKISAEEWNAGIGTRFFLSEDMLNEYCCGITLTKN